MNPEFVLAKKTDINSIITLMKEFYEIEHLRFDKEKIADTLTAIIDTINCLIYFIKINNKEVGYFVITFGYSLEFYGRFALVDELYLREEFRGKGIGKSSLRFIEDTCRLDNVSAVRLEVNRINIKAMEIYKNTGFKDDERLIFTKWLK